LDSTDTLQSTTPAVIAPSRIRFDDAVTPSVEFTGKELQKFMKHIEWCLCTDVLLTPAVLCQATEEVPGAIEALRRSTEEHIIYPDLHGWDHGPYQDRTLAEVCEHLDRAQGWFQHHLGVPAIRWVTPHGSDSPAMREAAAQFDLVIETTADPVIDQKVLDTKLRQTRDLRWLADKVVMVHWWERGLRLYRIAQIINHQSISGAIDATRSVLRAKDHAICWSGWGI
jgi:hypothetical protein